MSGNITYPTFRDLLKEAVKEAVREALTEGLSPRRTDAAAQKAETADQNRPAR